MPRDEMYPGDGADVSDLLEMAIQYQAAAHRLYADKSATSPAVLAPARFCALHAIELFLNAYLRQQGQTARQIRARLHNLNDDEFAKTLRLRKRTAQHMSDLTAEREYLITRYGPELIDRQTPVNRLLATLDEVAKKTLQHVSEQKLTPPEAARPT